MRQLLLFVLAIAIIAGSACQRPEKKPDRVFHNNYGTQEILIISSDARKTEGWIEVQEKVIEGTYGETDTLYLVFRKDALAGFITSDGRTFRCAYELLPYESEFQSDRIKKEHYVGTWKSIETSVQQILGLNYPVKVK